MAKRKTIQQKEVEAVMTKHLDKLGRKIQIEARKTSKVRTGDLRDSQNFRTKPYNVLTVSQNYYGKDLYLRGKYEGEKNALKVAVDKLVPDTVNIIIKDMIDLLKSPIKQKK